VIDLGEWSSFCLRRDGPDQQGQQCRQAVLERLELLHEFIWYVEGKFSYGRTFFIDRWTFGSISI